MTKAEACRTLHVAATADEEIMTQAYWHLARRYRADAKRDPEARRKLDELNDAFAVLHPSGAQPPRLNGAASSDDQPEPSELAVGDELFGWVRGLAAQIGERWPGRGTEIAALGAAVSLLAILALNAGASALWTLFALAVALITIWAPWRKS